MVDNFISHKQQIKIISYEVGKLAKQYCTIPLLKIYSYEDYTAFIFMR